MCLLQPLLPKSPPHDPRQVSGSSACDRKQGRQLGALVQSPTAPTEDNDARQAATIIK